MAQAQALLGECWTTCTTVHSSSTLEQYTQAVHWAVPQPCSSTAPLALYSRFMRST